MDWIMDIPPPPGHLLGPQFQIPPRAVFATQPAISRGRFYGEPESPTRTCYQRDRDRIVHSAAFRRLKHKTQVFVQHEGDYYRTRLTHSLEVAQIARSLARLFGLDEDLAEALALAHDLGHPPFGHAGEAALDSCMQTFGGFDHNAQALVLVTRLERRYAAYDGLNLTWETLEGLIKHNGPLVRGEKERADLPAAIRQYDAGWDLELATQAGPEAQVAALADDIAYVNHDIDDGLRAGLFPAEDLFGARLAGPVFREIARQHPGLEAGRLIGEGVRRLITLLVNDVAAQTRERLDAVRPRSAADIRAQADPVVAFSPAMSEEVVALKAFLFERMYRHPRVTEAMGNAQRVVRDLFAAYCADPALMPADWAEICRSKDADTTARAVCDYIAGMTDSYALQEHKRIFHIEIPL
jgi:dGTPase